MIALISIYRAISQYIDYRDRPTHTHTHTHTHTRVNWFSSGASERVSRVNWFSLGLQSVFCESIGSVRGFRARFASHLVQFGASERVS